MIRILLVTSLAALMWAQPARAQPTQTPDLKALQQQVFQTEKAFAKSMANRDFAAFETFLSQEAVFFSGPVPLRGKAAVAAFWKRFFEKPVAPFSWEPERVEVLESRTLALSTGPVRDPSGAITGSFTSIWRQEKPGVWRIVLDKGNACP